MCQPHHGERSTITMKKNTAASIAPESAPAPDVAPPAAKATTKASRKAATPQKAARAAKNAPAKKKAAAKPAASKKDVILALISRKGGATLAEIMAASGQMEKNQPELTKRHKLSVNPSCCPFQRDREERRGSVKTLPLVPAECLSERGTDSETMHNVAHFRTFVRSRRQLEVFGSY